MSKQYVLEFLYNAKNPLTGKDGDFLPQWGEDYEDALFDHYYQYDRKFIGPPEATSGHDVDELREQTFVGFYRKIEEREA